MLGAALEVGLSGPSRLHDLFVACEAMTPGDYKAEPATADDPLGPARQPLRPRAAGGNRAGLCWLSFVIDGDDGGRDLRGGMGGRHLVRDEAATAE